MIEESTSYEVKIFGRRQISKKGLAFDYQMYCAIKSA